MKKIMSIDEKVKIYEDERVKKRKSYILSLDFDNLSWDLKREYLIYDNKNKCDNCGISEWMGTKIVIEINHIDGDNKNNIKDNLECLCPNCHSITKNWRGRNKTKKRFKISNKDLLKVLIKNDWNIRKSLIEIGITPKGGNYKRCHQIKREFEEFGDIVTELKLTPSFKKQEFESIFNKFETYTEISNFIGTSINTAIRISEGFGLKKVKKIICPDRDVLLSNFNELKTFTSVGRKYGVSDNAVRKWCKKYDILDICKNVNKRL